MSIESELETLFVRIKLNTEDLLPSNFYSEIEKVSKAIEDTFSKNTVGLVFDYVGLARYKKRVMDDFTHLRSFVRGILQEIEDMTEGLDATAINAFSDSATAALGKIKSAFSSGTSTATQLNPITQFLRQMRLFSDDTKTRIDKAGQAISDFRAKMDGIQASPGLAAFRQQVYDLRIAISGLRAVSSAPLKISFTGVKDSVDLITKALQGLDMIKTVKLRADVRQMQMDVLSAPLPIRTVTVRGRLSIPNIPPLNLTITGLGGVAARFNRANAALVTYASNPSWQVLSKNAITSAAAIMTLNQQLERNVELLRKARRAQQAAARTPMPANLTSGVGVGINRDNIFGFDPIRRFLAVGTSIATGAAIGFLGYDMMRQVSGFDEAMTNAMSLRSGAGRGVRETMENEILNLSRRVATGPRELAEAYRELTVAGYGTANSIEALAIVEQFAFVGAMDAAKAARELTTLQRQLGLVEEDAARNASNLKYIADTIAAVALRSGMSVEVFTNGLERLTPHIRFLNGGLEDSVALLAAFSRIDASTAVGRAQALLRAVTSQFIRSEETAGARTGAPGRDPIGDHFRRFNPGAGVHPMHQLTDSIRQTAREWRGLGIEVFRGLPGQERFVGIAETIRQIDQATRHLSDQGREEVLSRLFPGQLRSTATDAIRALLSSSEAMEGFLFLARRADGVLDQVANDRLQSFNSQLAILKNNLVVVAIEVGRVLAPGLREINQLIIAGLDAWWELGGAGRFTILTFVGVGLGLLALRVLIPVIIGLLKTLLWDTLVSGLSFVASFFTVVWKAMVFGWYAVYYAVVAVIAVINSLRYVMILWNAVSMTTQIILFLLQGALYGYNIAVALAIAADIIFKAVMLALNFVLGMQATLWIINKVSIWLYSAAAWAGAASALALKVAVWLLNVALTTTLAIVIALLAVTGLLIALFAVLAALLVVIGVLLAVIVVAGLLLIAAGVLLIIDAMGGWGPAWETFVEWTKHAFWVTVGFFDNFRHNMQTIMAWLDMAWPRVILNITEFTSVAFTNLWENIKTGFAQLIMFMAREAVAMLNNRNVRAALLLINPAAGLLIPANANDIVPLGIQQHAARQMRELGQGANLRDIPALRVAPQGAEAALIGGLGQIHGIRLGVSGATREMIDNMFGRPNVPGNQENVQTAVDRIGTTFREISLNRFVLESNMEQEDLRQQQLEEARQANRWLELIAQILQQVPVGPVIVP